MPKLMFAMMACSLLVGCATTATQQVMSVEYGLSGVTPGEKLLKEVYVGSVTQGKATNLPWTSQVDTDAFKAALEQSLGSMGYMADSSTAKYKIDAELQDLAQPGFGLKYYVKSTVRYTISEAGNSRSLPITVTGIARASDALYSRERLKIAREHSVSENISKFIEQLTDQFGK